VRSSRRAASGHFAAARKVSKIELTKHCRIAAERWHLSDRSAITNTVARKRRTWAIFGRC
jgi:hypothetical protein